MRHFDNSKLRAQVIRDYESMAHDINDAQEMDRFVDAVVATTIGSLREILHSANQVSLMGRIPPDILAACFAHLPFTLHRIRASHVCRSWRAAALSDPTLWSRIEPYSRSYLPELLDMVLSRSGTLPVDLNVPCNTSSAPEDIYAAVAPYSRKLRYLGWPCANSTIPWECPAPILEHLCVSSTLTINGRFLGGQVGRLRGLYVQCVHLPAVCPVLSTVTDLSVASTPHGEDTAPSSLRNVFDLFPRLERLQILGMTTDASDMLPAGPAPATLWDLALHSRSWNYDLTPHFLAWDTGNIRHVTLSQYPGVHPNIERMASGAVLLAVNHSTDKWSTNLMFGHSGNVTHSVSVTQLGIANAAALLAALQLKLNDVHTAKISHVALAPLADVLTALPNLEHLFVHIVPETEGIGVCPNMDPHAFSWAPLSCLAQLARGMRKLRAITLHVWCGYSYRPVFANAHDARGLIAQLRALQDTLPQMEIQGFPAHEVVSVDLTGLSVRFDHSAEAGPLILYERRWAYSPFRD